MLVYNGPMTEPMDLPLIPANENDSVFCRADTALDELYRLRREILKEDVARMSFARRRSRDEALKQFAQAEALLLGKL